ncbi:hypothetical protein RT874_001856 [Campylobacter upsaliensis]|nr:hypothetical protein [Campylobacter upsaliensis]
MNWLKREQGKKASQKSKAKFNAFCGGWARSSKIKQGGSRVRSLKREFIKRVAAG